MRKILLVFLGVYWYLFPALASASGEFFVKQNVDYKFDSLGRSTVTLHISLTNKTANYYASRYELELVGENPQNVSGTLPVTTEPRSPDSTLVTVTIDKPAIGKDKVTEFWLKYQGRPAVRNGQVWEISLPKLANPAAVDEYTLNLIIPPAFGQPIYLSPPPASSEGNIYVFGKNELSQIGVAAAFGNFQTFSFKLKYKTAQPSQIALPSDTAYQRIFFDSISPPPDSVTADANGNWLASFNPGEIVVTGQAHVLTPSVSPGSWAQSWSSGLTPTPEVQVSYASYKEYPVRPAIFKWQPPLFILPFIPATFRLQITNPNSQAIYANPVTLPPYGSKILTARYTLTRPFDFSPKSITLINMTYNIPTTLFLPWQISLAVLISLTLITGSLYLQIKRFSRRLHHKH